MNHQNLVNDIKEAYLSGEIKPALYNLRVIVDGKLCGCGLGAAIYKNSLEIELDSDGEIKNSTNLFIELENKYNLSNNYVSSFIFGFDSLSSKEKDVSDLDGLKDAHEIRKFLKENNIPILEKY